MHICMPMTDFDAFDEYLSRIFVARQRPAWRRRLFDGLTHLRSLSDLRVLRAVERRTTLAGSASVRDVAEEMGIEHSTASRAVATVVQAGFLDKTQAAEDQRRCLLELTPLGVRALAEATSRRRAIVAEHVAHWPEQDVERLTQLLGRLADEFEEQSSLP